MVYHSLEDKMVMILVLAFLSFIAHVGRRGEVLIFWNILAARNIKLVDQQGENMEFWDFLPCQILCRQLIIARLVWLTYPSLGQLIGGFL